MRGRDRGRERERKRGSGGGGGGGGEIKAILSTSLFTCCEFCFNVEGSKLLCLTLV